MADVLLLPMAVSQQVSSYCPLPKTMRDVQCDNITLQLEATPQKSWYHGRLSRCDAEERLTSDGRPGCFLIRESTSRVGLYVLSYLGKQDQQDFSHFRITALCGDYYIGGRSFASLSDLVAYYTNWSDLLVGERLLYPLNPPVPVDDQRRVRALYPYAKIPDTDELSFEKGDIFNVSNVLGDGWLWVTSLRTGECGIIYQDLVVDVDEQETVDQLPFYHASLSIEQLKVKLAQAGPYSFLLKDSDSSPGDYTLYCYCPRAIQRFKIQRHGKSFLMGGRLFNRISEITERYKTEEILSGVTLATAVEAERHDATCKPGAQLAHISIQRSSGVNFLTKRTDNIIMQGYLLMKKGDRTAKKWKNMFFVLNAFDHHLYYIEDPKRSKPNGMVDLNYCYLYPVHESLFSRPCCMQLVCRSLNHFQIYYLCSDNWELAKEWSEALRPCCRGGLSMRALPGRLSVATAGDGEHAPVAPPLADGAKEVYSLRVEVQDVKYLPSKLAQVVYCQLHLNNVAVAQTQARESHSPVWNEQFLLEELPGDVDYFVVVLLGKTRRNTKDQELFQVSIRLDKLQVGEEMDEWHPMIPATSLIKEACAVRLKVRFHHEVVLPLADYRDLKEVLLSKDLQAVSALGMLGVYDRAALAQSLLRIFRHEHKEEVLLKTMNSLEIAREDDMSTLFRATSLATTLMDQYMKMVASGFLKSALQHSILKVTENKVCLELNPSMLGNPDDAEGHCVELILLLNEFTNSIFSATGDCPQVLRHICYCLQKSVALKWPDNEVVQSRVVSGFIFLRLLCPAIINPKAFNLVPEVPSDATLRSLKLVAKSLINLANLVELKEQYMEPINPFITDNKERMAMFLRELSNVPDISDSSVAAVDDVAHDYATIHHMCASHIKELLQMSITQPMLKRLVTVTEILSKANGLSR